MTTTIQIPRASNMIRTVFIFVTSSTNHQLNFAGDCVPVQNGIKIGFLLLFLGNVAFANETDFTLAERKLIEKIALQTMQKIVKSDPTIEADKLAYVAFSHAAAFVRKKRQLYKEYSPKQNQLVYWGAPPTPVDSMIAPEGGIKPEIKKEIEDKVNRAVKEKFGDSAF